MASTIDENMFDQRVVARHIKRGLINQSDYDGHLESLEDCAELGEPCETEFSYRLADEDGESERSEG